jgi:hypothetical protein
LLGASALHAQPAAVADPAAGPAAAGAEAGSGRGGEPEVRRSVIQDEGSRIDELRVRGETQRISVQPRRGARYEIVPAGGARDLATGPTTPRGAVGQRVWRVLQF